MEVTPFSFIDAINSGADIFSGDTTELEKQYNAYIINRQFSLFTDTVFYANEMNMNPDVDKYGQYLYYYNSVRRKKRFAKWPKKHKTDDLQLVSDYYGVNYRKSQVYLSLLSEEQLKDIKLKLETGGKG